MSRLFLALLKSFFDAQFQSLQEPEPKLLPRSAIHSTEQSRAQHAFCFWLCCLFRLSFSRSGVEQSRAQHSTEHSTAQQSRAAVCFCFCFLFLSLRLESSTAQQSNAQHSRAQAQHRAAQHRAAQHSKAKQSGSCLLLLLLCVF